MKRVTQSLAAILLAGCATWALPAMAQESSSAQKPRTAAPATPPAGETAAGSATQIEEVVVTAQFRAQSVQNTPLSITAVSKEMLQARGQLNIQAVADQIPNVTLKPASGVWGPSLVASIRGVGAYNNNPTFEPGVGVFIDDVYLATLTGSMLDLVDVDRIEVLRGPQGTLTGRNSIGGAIRIVSQAPTGDNSGYVEAFGGSDNLLGVRSTLNLRINDAVSLRLSGLFKRQDGYVKRLDFGCVHPGQGIAATLPAGHCELGDPLGGAGDQAVRGMLRIHPSDRLDVLITADYEHENHTGPGNVLLQANYDNALTNPAPGVPLDSRFICGKFCNYATFETPAMPGRAGSSADPMTTYSGGGVSGRINLNLTDTAQLTSITAYRGYKTSYGADDDATSAGIELFDTHIRHHFFSEELRLNGEFDRLKYTVGGFYSSQKTVLGQFSDIPTLAIQYVSNDPVPTKTAAAFATGIFSVTDQLTITGGIRYTHEQKRYTFHHTRLDGTVDDPAIEGASSLAETGVVDYRASIDYRVNPNFLAYFTFSTGFRGGGINPVPFSAALVLPFGPEKLQNFELGFKSDLFDRRLRINGTIFYDKYKDVQLTTLSCPQLGLAFCVLVVNAGTAGNKGAELEITARPVDNLLIDASYSYLDFKYTSLDSSTFLSLSNVTPFTPKTKLSFGIQYDVDMAGAGTLTPRFDASYQSAIFTNAANAPTNRISPYTVANAHLTWRNRGGDLTAALHVTNLFNKYYLLNNYDESGFFGFVIGYPARPREFSVSLRKTFG